MFSASSMPRARRPALGDEQAERAAFLIVAPFRCAIDDLFLFNELSLAQGVDDLAEGGAFDGQALRKGKERAVGALRRRAQDHKLSILEFKGRRIRIWT